MLPIAPSTYHDHVMKRADPTRRSPRARRDGELRPEIRRVFDANFQVYGVRKVWRQMRREGFDVARCTVARQMKQMGIQGIVRGKRLRSTVPDKAAPCPLDRINRQFQVPAPNRLWVRDFTYVATWQGFVTVAFVIDASARRIVGWRVSRTAHAGFVLDALLDALEQAVHQRRPVRGKGQVHHSDRGTPYLAIRYTERPAEAGIEPSVGSVGDSYDNALVETINGLFKAEVIHRRGRRHGFQAVEYATLEWVDRFNNRRLLEPIGNIPPAEAEAHSHAALEMHRVAASLRPTGLRENRCGSRQGFFIPNKEDKYSVGLNGGMKLNEEGGIAIRIAAEQPEGVPAENWLPITREDRGIDVIMRVYQPDLEKMKTWTPPKAELVR